MDSDGRYVVSLPWIQGHPPLPTCRNLAERRLKNCINSLKKTGNLEAYEGVFSEWLKEGVIEEVKNYCNDKSDHYLPHRGNDLIWGPKPIVEAPLPEDRVKEAAVFEVVEIDYAGPLILKG
ncbi:DUF1758 domain-containing protein [Trichonephila inaurata madagascariensis]|uniref:DUF1758 domain-containing protein n=1 Tax=Trichonephila inaurata madagascariensis TaxID=2747483 RepID=A0A8X6YGM3_9ARAC|nr:DUF1758 domain-containing protein [Trichonephila inaurata madagascariensis]